MQFQIQNKYKLNIFTHKIQNPIGILIHIPGLGGNFQVNYNCIRDFSERVKLLSKIGIKSYGLELRGHGKSSGLNASIDSFDEYLDDLNKLVKYIKKYHIDLPIYILGESMGASIAIKYSMKKKYKIAGIIAISPICGTPKHYYLFYSIIYLILLTSYIFPKWGIYMKQPNIKFKDKSLIRLETAREYYNSVQWIEKHMFMFTIPIIVFQSESDIITCPITTKDFLNNCSSIDKKLVLYKDGCHSLLIPQTSTDKTPNKIFNKICSWLHNKNKNITQ